MFNPSLHTATNKPIGLTNKPVDARTYYYDTTTFSYRPYTNTAEVLAYLVGTDRTGHFPIIIGTDEYWFKDGIADSDLVLKSAGEAIPAFAIPAGSAIPFNIDVSAYALSEFTIPRIEMLTDGNFTTATKGKPVYDVEVIINYTNNTRKVISSFDVYGHPDPDSEDPENPVTTDTLVLKLR